MDLPFNTLTQFVALGLTLVAGWFLGLASSSGGRKWRERYYDAENDNASYRDQASEDFRNSAKRVRELEAENAKLRAGAPVVEEGHSTAALAGAAVAGAVAGAAVTHAVEEHHAEPAQAEPAHAEPAHAEPAHHEPAHADHAEPAHGPAVAHDDHGHPEPALAHGTPADAHPAPADAHHH